MFVLFMPMMELSFLVERSNGDLELYLIHYICIECGKPNEPSRQQTLTAALPKAVPDNLITNAERLFKTSVSRQDFTVNSAL